MEALAELAKVVTLPVAMLLAALASGARASPAWVFGPHHRETVARLERALEKAEKQRDDAIQLNYRLLGLAEKAAAAAP